MKYIPSSQSEFMAQDDDSQCCCSQCTAYYTRGEEPGTVDCGDGFLYKDGFQRSNEDLDAGWVEIRNGCLRSEIREAVEYLWITSS